MFTEVLSGIKARRLKTSPPGVTEQERTGFVLETLAQMQPHESDLFRPHPGSFQHGAFLVRYACEDRSDGWRKPE